MLISNNEINQKLSEVYKRYTDEFLAEYKAAYHDDNAPSRINEFGIIDDKRFDTDKRILVIAKETNGWSNEEFDKGVLFRPWMEEISRNGLQGHDHIRRYPTMWYNMGRWIELILNPDADLVSLSKEKAPAINALGTVAFTNINKVRGTHISGAAYKKIAYTDIVGKVLREEISIIKPKIILCCGTCRPFHFHVPETVYNGTIYYMPHSAARLSSLEMLKDLCSQIHFQEEKEN